MHILISSTFASFIKRWTFFIHSFKCAASNLNFMRDRPHVHLTFRWHISLHIHDARAVRIRIWIDIDGRWGADQCYTYSSATRPPTREIYLLEEGVGDVAKNGLLHHIVPQDSIRTISIPHRGSFQLPNSYIIIILIWVWSSSCAESRWQTWGSIHIRARGSLYDSTTWWSGDATILMMTTTTTHLSLNFRRLWLQFNFPSNTLLIMAAYHHHKTPPHPHTRCCLQNRIRGEELVARRVGTAG